MPGRHLLLAPLSWLIVATLVACGGAEPVDTRWMEPPAVTAAPTTKPPRPAPSSTPEVRTQARLAMLDLSRFRPETAELTDENTDGWYLRALCRQELPSDHYSMASRERRWENSPVWIRQYVVGFRKVTGRKLLDELRSVLKTCRTYRTSDKRTSTVVAWRPPGVAEDPDVVTFCERQKSDTGVVSQCTVLMARGHYVMEVDASDGDGDLARSQAMTAKLYPLMAVALLKAS